MSRYRRLRLEGASYFFTVNLADREAATLVDRIEDLRRAYAHVWQSAPWQTDAIVVLPDHLHAIWTLPPGDSDFSDRWRRIKREFTVITGLTGARSASKHRKGEAGLWQRRFWEHCLRSETERLECLRYVWANPVKHGLVDRAVDWPHSSVHREIRHGLLPTQGP